MSVDREELKTELKNNTNEIIDLYRSNDNLVLEIPEDNIYMEFIISNQNYIAFTEDSSETEEMEIMFAKVDFMDNNKILRNIESAQEYEMVVNEFYRRLDLISEVGDDVNE